MIFKKFGEGILAGILAALSLLLVVGFIFAPMIFSTLLILKLVGTITFGWFYVFLPLIIFFGSLILEIAIAYICAED